TEFHQFITASKERIAELEEEKAILETKIGKKRSPLFNWYNKSRNLVFKSFQKIKLSKIHFNRGNKLHKTRIIRHGSKNNFAKLPLRLIKDKTKFKYKGNQRKSRLKAQNKPMRKKRRNKR
ncbi:hypothetical protein J4471_04245, partial [Candidatus Woesearchaeota archaeon]|nr:hypothetical protein [Candidatus Woesearchaeota archaeon]